LPLRCKGNAPSSPARPGYVASDNSPALRVVILRQALLGGEYDALCRQCKGEAVSDGKINDVYFLNIYCYE